MIYYYCKSKVSHRIYAILVTNYEGKCLKYLVIKKSLTWIPLSGTLPHDYIFDNYNKIQIINPKIIKLLEALDIIVRQMGIELIKSENNK